MARHALAIRHVHFEDLGSIAPALADAGWTVEYRDAASDDLAAIDPLAPDLVVVLGGPIAAYDEDAYPVVATERALLARRLAADRPTLGICLGAQLIAAALGAAVRPGTREIGWAPVELTAAGAAGPLAALGTNPVLHWHGDTFDLPTGCALLAATAACPHQAFARGPNVLALQFHVEATGAAFEHWLIGHAAELATARINPVALRTDARRHAPTLERACAAMVAEWLAALR